MTAATVTFLQEHVPGLGWAKAKWAKPIPLADAEREVRTHIALRRAETGR